ncbi:MAG: GNAT family N-acetyltransferase, partial [Actinobacteria bacterium]|nr:GNAT family N-acetyltransferase [Actinomycetota bacterium]
SVCELYSDGITAQIEDVSTLTKHRSQGLATATVLRALHEARAWGHEMIFLVADADDWPKELYTKLGFTRWETDVMFSRDERAESADSTAPQGAPGATG